MESTMTQSHGSESSAEAGPWRSGTVVDTDGDSCYVSLADRVHAVRRAVSCLVAPEVGDRVVVFGAAEGELYLTHVLGRNGAMPVTIESADGLALRSPRIELHAGDSLHLEGRQLDARFERVHWLVSLLEATGLEFILHSRAAKLFSHVAEVVTGRLQIGAERSYRNISEAEHLRTGLLDMKAEHAVRIRSDHTILTARELVKVDGSQIHVG